ncbi:uncharacterized protein LOC144579968 [Callithrix jacchus]
MGLRVALRPEPPNPNSPQELKRRSPRSPPRPPPHPGPQRIPRHRVPPPNSAKAGAPHRNHRPPPPLPPAGHPGSWTRPRGTPSLQAMPPGPLRGSATGTRARPPPSAPRARPAPAVPHPNPRSPPQASGLCPARLPARRPDRAPATKFGSERKREQPRKDKERSAQAPQGNRLLPPRESNRPRPAVAARRALRLLVGPSSVSASPRSPLPGPVARKPLYPAAAGTARSVPPREDTGRGARGRGKVVPRRQPCAARQCAAVRALRVGAGAALAADAPHGRSPGAGWRLPAARDRRAAPEGAVVCVGEAGPLQAWVREGGPVSSPVPSPTPPPRAFPEPGEQLQDSARLSRGLRKVAPRPRPSGAARGGRDGSSEGGSSGRSWAPPPPPLPRRQSADSRPGAGVGALRPCGLCRALPAGPGWQPSLAAPRGPPLSGWWVPPRSGRLSLSFDLNHRAKPPSIPLARAVNSRRMGAKPAVQQVLLSTYCEQVTSGNGFAPEHCPLA